MINPNKEIQLRNCKVVRVEKNCLGARVTILHKTTLIQDVFNNSEVKDIEAGDDVTGYIKFSIVADKWVISKINKRR
jgi:hypothetical protein